MLDQEGVAGATEFVAVPFGPPDQVARTLETLADVDRAFGSVALQ